MGEAMETVIDAGEGEADGGATLTPALVREVAEKVYALWVQDLRVEQERLGRQGNQHKRGRNHRHGRR